ncbi:MAG: hypothetical protein WBA28_05165 [Microbacteriaceae bacterium]
MVNLTVPFGNKARVGLILPADNVTMEPEVYSLDLPGVSFNTLRLTETDHHEMRKQAPKLSSTIHELGLDAIVYACAETSFNDGLDTSQKLTEILVEKSGLPLITATNSMLAALAALQAHRLAVVSPYNAKSGSDLEETLTTNGFDVVASSHHDFLPESGDPRVWFATNRQPKDITLRFLAQLDMSQADAILIPSTNWPTLAVIQKIEELYRLPVITSNQSILWWLNRELKLDLSIPELGRIFTLTHQESR